MKNSTKKDIVIFGCGGVGYECFTLLGRKNVLCFCDNNKTLQGKMMYGIPVISIKDLKQKNNFTVIICAKKDKAYTIACQLEEEEITDYWSFPIIREIICDFSSDDLLDYLRDTQNMCHMRHLFYREKIDELETQVEYFKQHADIKTMKPATGWLRDRQLELIDLGALICQALNQIQIRPILYAGNLLGYVRHRGFIPWDDDLDFLLIRKEYEQFIQYCKTQQKKNGFVKFQSENRTEILIFREFHNHLKLCKETEDGEVKNIDFFSLDYYADTYPFEQLNEYAKTLKRILFEMKNEDERIIYVRKMIEESPYRVIKSNSLYFGYDSIPLFLLYNKGRMIPENIIFPLKSVVFDGQCFWIPNNPEEFLSYIYEDMWDFPEDVGLQKHV